MNRRHQKSKVTEVLRRNGYLCGRSSLRSWISLSFCLCLVLCFSQLRYGGEQRLPTSALIIQPFLTISVVQPFNSSQVLPVTSFASLSQTSQSLPRRNNSRNLCGYVSMKTKLALSSPGRRESIRTMPVVLSLSSSPNDNEQKLHRCRSNAILYMAQKGKHSSYGRNSTALFLKSLDLLYQNYLAIDRHYDNVDVLIFHSGDYTSDDLHMLDRRYNSTVSFQVIDLSNTEYWSLPESVRHDNASQWTVYPQFSVGYRHMMRWYGLKLYDFIRDVAQEDGACPQYRYVMRMDEDSYIHSPIQYDLFDFMKQSNYAYAFRMCAFEMETDVWDDYVDHVQYCSSRGGSTLPPGIPQRPLHPELCGFYNNFFIIDMDFVLQPDVQHFLQWIDATGIIYRERYNDLQIQTLAVYAFTPPERIHRFLDWTYEHMTRSKKCPIFGAIQAGYRDLNYKEVFAKYKEEINFNSTKCNLRRKSLSESNLSPTYAHLPSEDVWRNETMGKVLPRKAYRWRTLASGLAELSDRGIHSG